MKDGIDVYCDECRTSRTVVVHTMRAARDALKKEGWSVQLVHLVPGERARLRDFCPACVKTT